MLALDPVTHDLYFSNLQLAVIPQNDDFLLQDVTQRLKVKLLWVRGEWFLNEDYGIPYFTEVFTKQATLASIDDLFKVAIADEEGVESLISFSSSFDSITRILNINCKIKLTNGETASISLGL